MTPDRHSGEGPAVFAVRRLDKRFGATCAVSDVSMEFHPGRVRCLLGENGAGKSTVGKMLAGLYAPDSGEITVDGRPIAPGDVSAARSAGVALVFQELSLAPALSIRDNICLGVQPRRRLLGWRGTRVEARLCWRVLDELGLDLPLDAVVGQLSPAHQQLVEVAKALVARPKLMILDEPTAMLGAVDRDRLFMAIRRLRDQGVAFVLVTHNIEDVLAIGDDVSILKDGRHVASFPITADLTVAEISRRLTGRQVAAPAPRVELDGDASEQVLRIDGVAHGPGAATPLEIKRGSIVALYGVVGCGREGIARSIVGLERPDPRRRMHLRGRAFAPSSPASASKQGIVYLPSGRAANCILPSLSIRENLMLRQLSHSLGVLSSRAKERRDANGQLALYGTRFASVEDPITSLSGGNQQKVILGRCLGAGGDLLVLEDPTAGVDIGAKEEIHDILRLHAKAGLAILLISSDLQETIAISDVVHTMFAGEIVSTYRAPLEPHQGAIIGDILGEQSRAGSKRKVVDVYHA